MPVAHEHVVVFPGFAGSCLYALEGDIPQFARGTGLWDHELHVGFELEGDLGSVFVDLITGFFSPGDHYIYVVQQRFQEFPLNL